MTQSETKWITKGDTDTVNALRGYAQSLMRDLLERMSFQNLSIDSFSAVPWPGARIRCQVNHSIKIIYIEVFPRGKKYIQKALECFCDCNFTIGKVIKVTTPGLDSLEAVPLYTVIACHKNRTYKVYENCLASDFTKYLNGQKVILMPYNEFNFLCFVDSQEPAVRGCSMKSNDKLISDTLWRSACRLVPWNGRTLKKWKDV